MSAVVIAVIVTALVFDFTNGFHDTANAMATSIATGALRPRTAVLLAGVLNLVGAFLSVQVALTISSGLVDEARITPAVIFGGLVGAILWNLLTWLLGLPSSSSHALFGGLIGATWMFAGSAGINVATVMGKVLVPLALSPIVAGVVALATTSIAYRIAARGDRHTVTRGFRSAQVVSASMVALAHGTNDAQKTMGVITLTLITVGLLPAHAGPPLWVVAACRAGHRRGHRHAVAGGSSGRWAGGSARSRARRGSRPRPATTAVILSSAHLGFALSTTQVTTGAILGAAAGRHPATVRWGVAARMAVDLAAHPAGRGDGGSAGGLGGRPRRGGDRAGRRRDDRRGRPASTASPGASRSPPAPSTTHRPRAAGRRRRRSGGRLSEEGRTR